MLFERWGRVAQQRGGPSLSRGWMEVDEVDVKMEVDVKRPLHPLHHQSVHPITFASSPFSSAQKCNMQSAQTSGECTTIMQCSLVQKVHF